MGVAACSTGVRTARAVSTPGLRPLRFATPQESNTGDKLRSGARVRTRRRGHEAAPPAERRLRREGWCRRKLRQLHPLVRRQRHCRTSLAFVLVARPQRRPNQPRAFEIEHARDKRRKRRSAGGAAECPRRHLRTRAPLRSLSPVFDSCGVAKRSGRNPGVETARAVRSPVEQAATPIRGSTYINHALARRRSCRPRVRRVTSLASTAAALGDLGIRRPWHHCGVRRNVASRWWGF